jgi:hypothetical protein
MKKIAILILLALIIIDLSDRVIGDGLHPLSEAPSFHHVKISYYYPSLISIEPKRSEGTFVEIISVEDLQGPRHPQRNKIRGLLRAPPLLTRHTRHLPG